MAAILLIPQSEWIAASPRPSANPPISQPTSFIVLQQNVMPTGGLPVAAPAPGTNPSSGPAAAYSPPQASDPWSTGAIAVLYASATQPCAATPGQAGLATACQPGRPAPPVQTQKHCGWAGCTLGGLASSASHTIVSTATSAYNYARNHPVDTALNVAMVALAFVPVGGEFADGAILAARGARGIEEVGALVDSGGIDSKLVRTVDSEYDAITTKGGDRYLSIRKRGPVLTGTADALTGDVVTSLNWGTDVANLHPTLVGRLSGEGLESFYGGPSGVHGEIHGINELLWRREDAGLSTEIDGTFTFYSRRLRGAEQGDQIPRCAACESLTSGAGEIQR
ncbi:YwqJ-related putative deaminase [Pseudofrankia sp. DC12]|uniref:YwqJ-related putative deaminase n=1 Tax=Pseudofrankia sp. DC12 TaxID=683315 RepID=UPI000A836256|nr:YwqJ-related putative deaminase [Pseudofrankia sp. DC12]